MKTALERENYLRECQRRIHLIALLGLMYTRRHASYHQDGCVILVSTNESAESVLRRHNQLSGKMIGLWIIFGVLCAGILLTFPLVPQFFPWTVWWLALLVFIPGSSLITVGLGRILSLNSDEMDLVDGWKRWKRSMTALHKWNRLHELFQADSTFSSKQHKQLETAACETDKITFMFAQRCFEGLIRESFQDNDEATASRLYALALELGFGVGPLDNYRTVALQ